MSGSSSRGHHFIPQFLLRGFSSRSRKKEYFSHLFRAGHPAIETNLRNIAKVRDFHGAPDEAPLERRLSEIENKQAQLVRQLRAREHLPRPEELASLVASIQVRSENIRKVMSESGRRFLSMMSQKMNSDAVKAIFTAGLAEEIRARLKSGYYQPQIDQIATENSRKLVENALISLHSQLPAKVDTFVSGFSAAIANTDFEAIATRSHLSVLNEEPIPQARVEQFNGFMWRVLTAERPVILGDVCVVADFEPRLPLSNLLSIEDGLDGIYLPLSTTTVLLGARRNGYEPRPIDEVNEASAALSAHFFATGSRTDEIKLLANSIGNRVSLMSDDEMRASLPEISWDTLREALLEERQRGLPKGGS